MNQSNESNRSIVSFARFVVRRLADARVVSSRRAFGSMCFASLLKNHISPVARRRFFFSFFLLFFYTTSTSFARPLHTTRAACCSVPFNHHAHAFTFSAFSSCCPTDADSKRVHERVGHQVRLEAEVLQLGVLRVVVVLLHLRPRVRDVDDLRVQADLLPRLGDERRELVHAELLRELVVNPHLALVRGVIARDLDAPHGVADVEEPARLAALAVHRHRVPDRGLDAESVQRRAEDGVVVEAVDERRVHHRLLRRDAVHDALVQVRRAHLPRLRAEDHVRAVVALREVVERVALLRVRQCVRPTVVLHGEVPLFDVDVRRPVLAHRAELDEVAVRRELLDRVHEVDVAHDVVRLREDRLGAVHHGVGRGALLAKVHRGGGLELLERRAEELVVAHVADEELDVLPGDFLPLPHALVDAPDRGQGVEPEGVVHAAAAEVVDDAYLVAAVAEVKRGRPAAVPVAADDHDALALARVRVVRLGAVRLRGGEDRGAKRADLGRLGGGDGRRREGGEGDAVEGSLARGERGGGRLRGGALRGGALRGGGDLHA
eukprot:30735-Pelagococcus_subviridis.AAC.10